MRGGKGWLYEGGIREPMLVRWPGVTQPGSVCEEPVVSIDFWPTLTEIAGVTPHVDNKIDGVSLVPLLKGQDSLPQRPLFWHYPHYSNQGGFPGGAIRIGNHKLIERYEDGRVHLYDLAADIGERKDLADAMPGRVREMRAQLHEWYRDVDAKFLRPKKNGPMPWRPESAAE